MRGKLSVHTQMSELANKIEAGRKRLHEMIENRLLHILFLLLVYGTLTASVVGILILIVAWYASDV